MKNVIKYIAASILLIFGLSSLAGLSFLSGFIFLIAGVFTLPVVHEKLKTPTWANWLIVLGLFFIGIGTFSGNDIEDSETGDSVKKVESSEYTISVEEFDSIANLMGFRIKTDEFKPGTAFYTHKNAPRIVNRNWTYPYISRTRNSYSLRYQMQYESSDWLFIRDAKVSITREDGGKEVVHITEGGFERDNNGGRIWEWKDMPVPEIRLARLRRIANAKSATIRYNGRQYHKDRKMTATELSVLRQTLKLFDTIQQKR